MDSMIKRVEKPADEKKPRCPYCNARPVSVFMNVISFAGAMAAIFACGNREKVLSVSPIEGPKALPEYRPSVLLPTM